MIVAALCKQMTAPSACNTEEKAFVLGTGNRERLIGAVLSALSCVQVIRLSSARGVDDGGVAVQCSAMQVSIFIQPHLTVSHSPQQALRPPRIAAIIIIMCVTLATYLL